MNATIATIISIAIFILIFNGLRRRMSVPIKSGVSLLLPILYVSTSLFQLLDPKLHVVNSHYIYAFGIGIVLSIPLIMTTNFEKRSGEIFIQRNKTLFIILISFFVIRLIFHGHFLSNDVDTSNFLMNMVMLSYITVWRMASYRKYKAVK
ncbi:CcdC protein domain-containing protein [Paenibacillus paeoniae]|uniref:DUF1453 family protein n=1 Tax=Paenibacillus paeoniae TaxID=2292705 RepID=A0A371PHF6_9BACL|nr:CcdC protein domain-containing protein [Paenibacillus paeoniae]REK75563.1 DUF1453 family protein [Paenibacillus paeoniae]